MRIPPQFHNDLHPRCAQQLMNTPRFTPTGRVARRKATKALLNVFGDGVIREARQSQARATARLAWPRPAYQLSLPTVIAVASLTSSS